MLALPTFKSLKSNSQILWDHASERLDQHGTAERCHRMTSLINYFAIVLRDSRVRRLISRTDCFSRSAPTDDV
jgi:hypothetical protein